MLLVPFRVRCPTSGRGPGTLAPSKVDGGHLVAAGYRDGSRQHELGPPPASSRYFKSSFEHICPELLPFKVYPVSPS